MRVLFEIMGRKLKIEVFGLNHISVETSNHDFFYSRAWWFASPSGGRDRHWVFARAGQATPTCDV